MAEGKIAVRYARAIFEAAVDKGILDRVRDDFESILLVSTELPEFRDLIESPVLGTSHKKEIFKLILKDKMEDLSLRFILLMADKKREAFIPAVCRIFIDLYKKEKGIKSATVTTASAMQEKTAGRIKAYLEEYYKCMIELKTSIKPDMIGGFVLRIDDQQIDASVLNQLKKIKKGLGQPVL